MLAQAYGVWNEGKSCSSVTQDRVASIHVYNVCQQSTGVFVSILVPRLQGIQKFSKEVGVYSLENRRLPKVVVASHLCRDEGKMGVNCL